MKYIIDRLEEEMAVCENESREMIPIPLKELSRGTRGGCDPGTGGRLLRGCRCNRKTAQANAQETYGSI